MDITLPKHELCEMLLHASRNGDITLVQDLISAYNEEKIELDINCKGTSKSNLGWTPLHLATYFGHTDVVELLLDSGADVNAVNDAGDTALHKAAFIGREDLVLLLVERNADVNVRNGEGRTAREVGAEGGVGTRRYCSSVDMGNYCNYIKQPGDEREYRSCTFTCSTDGCNAGNQKTISIAVFITAIASFMWFS